MAMLQETDTMNSLRTLVSFRPSTELILIGPTVNIQLWYPLAMPYVSGLLYDTP